MKRAGRVPKLTQEIADGIIKLTEVGNYAHKAAQAVGVSRRTFYRWMALGRRQRTGPFRDFREAVLRARAKAQAVHVTLLRAAAENDWRAAAFFLERSDPKRWGRRTVVEHAGGINAKHTGELKTRCDERLIAAARQPGVAATLAGLLEAIGHAGEPITAPDMDDEGGDSVQEETARA